MRILVVDDEEAIRVSLGGLLRRAGHQVREAAHAPEALQLLEDGGADVVLSDLSMPAVDGLALFERIQQRGGDPLFVLMTAHGDERVAVRAMKAGVYDYIPKPFDNEEILAMVRRAREVILLRAENARLRSEVHGPVEGLIGDSAPMLAVYDLIRKVGPTTASVLITGESGTGKELVARALHQEGSARRGQFVALNCSAIPEELVESELFGHVRGAFTGADKERRGLIEAADEGTLFLDEVGDLAPGAQAKLLRVLEEREVTPVGSNETIPVDVRVIAATHRDLQERIREGAFREDLLFRLRVVGLALPPLRERREDIPMLSGHFLRLLAKRHGKEISALAEGASAALASYDWPGNVRELRNALERAVVLSMSESVELADLPPEISGLTHPPGTVDGASEGTAFSEARDHALAAFERNYLGAALRRQGGNISQTARDLGMHRQSLQRILRRLGIKP